MCVEPNDACICELCVELVSACVWGIELDAAYICELCVEFASACVRGIELDAACKCGTWIWGRMWGTKVLCGAWVTMWRAEVVFLGVGAVDHACAKSETYF